ncbi:MAG: hypothetical protein NZ750_12235 [Anaerolineae bacterium]|nr:hypothetical protein [Anaerolineae bacterium]MDW8172117.1 hypothetical protein [Anaerolineae bacterium]
MMMNDYVALIEARQHQNEAAEFARKERLIRLAREALMERLDHCKARKDDGDQNKR